jgi:hypothetical protein
LEEETCRSRSEVMVVAVRGKSVGERRAVHDAVVSGALTGGLVELWLSSMKAT